MLMITDNLWKEISEFLVRKEKTVGRPAHDARLTLSGILYIMQTGAQWRNLPDYYGKKSTVHGWLMVWIRSGIFYKIFEKSIEVAIKQLGSPTAFITDTTSSKAPFAKFSGKNPTDRAKRGVKKGIIIDWNRIILSVIVDAANTHDSKLLLPHMENIKSFLDRPKVLAADSAWDIKNLRKKLAAINLALHASTNVRRDKTKKKIRPRGRWRIEQIFGIQQWNRGIKFCWTKTKEAFLGFCQFASSIHNFKLVGIFG